MQLTPLIAGNWKMNTTIEEACALVSEMLPELKSIKGVEIVICPPFISLPAVNKLLSGTPLYAGAQNMYHQEKGAFTGEISPVMLKGICQYVILGHSERRNLFNEDEEMIQKKVDKALETGLQPILCIGETLSEREQKKAESTITRQIETAFENVDNPGEVVIAYEPVWAIGTGVAATVNDVNQMITIIRSVLSNIYNQEISREVRILYGGSVNSQNFGNYISQHGINGALVGGASLKPDEFINISRLAEQSLS